MTSCYIHILKAHGQSSLYEQVGQLVLDGENFFTQPHPKLKEAIDFGVLSDQPISSKSSSDFQKKEKKATKIMLLLSPFERKKMVFSLLHNFGTLKDSHCVMKPYVAQELNIAIGLDYSKQLNLYKTVDRTSTTFGTAVLATNLANPLADKDEILKRQKAVQYLVDNQPILEKLSNTLKENVAQHENGFLNYFNPNANLAQELFEMVYWSKNSWFKSLNKRTSWRYCWGKSDEITYALHPFVESSRFLAIFLLSIVLGNAYDCLITLKKPVNNLLNFLKTRYHELINDKDFRRFSYILAGTSFGYRALYYKHSLQNFAILRSIYKGLYDRTVDVSYIYKSLNQCHSIIKEIPELKEACGTFAHLNNFVHNNFSNDKKVLEDMKKLKNLLNHKVFDKHFNWLSHTGVIQVAHLYITELKNYFVKALEALGEIDALISVAKVFKEHSQQETRYCLVDIIDTQVPYVHVIDAWCPLIGEKFKPLSIEFGGSQLPNKIMITGPHGGGKSTLERTIAHAKILNQTYGIAPAKEARLSVEDKIGSFMNVKEDLSKGQSKFMAEKARVVEIVKDIEEAVKNKQKIIVFMDEVYSGTMEDQGALMLFNFGKSLAQTEHCMLMIATHFKEHVHSLENLYPNFFKNYHFEIKEMNDRFVRSFDLKEGRCEWWFADPARRNRYIEQLATEEQSKLTNIAA